MINSRTKITHIFSPRNLFPAFFAYIRVNMPPAMNMTKKYLLTMTAAWTLAIIPALSAPQITSNRTVSHSDTLRNRPRVAVVLSGGGAKGMAHIGVLKVLERAGIPVDIITGTSMGSIVGALYAVGWNAERLDSLVRGQDWSFLLSDRDDYYSQNLLNRDRQATYFLSKAITLQKGKVGNEAGGLVEGKNLKKLFTHLTAGYADSMDFRQLPIPYACVATDIVDYSEYVFHSGTLPEAMRSSMAIPAVFTPVRIGQHVLVDGGLRNNYPADIAREMGADYIVGSTVQAPERSAEDLLTGSGILGHIIDVNCKNKFEENIAITDVPIWTNTKGFSAASFSEAAIDSLIKLGEKAAMAHWDELLALKRKMGLTEDYSPTRPTLRAEAALPLNFSDEEEEARPAHDILRGSIALRFDSEEKVAAQLNGVYSSSRRPIDAELTIRLGQRFVSTASVRWKPKRFALLGLTYSYEYNDLDIHDEGIRSFSFTYNRHHAHLGIIGASIRNLAFDTNIAWDYYHVGRLLASDPATSTRPFRDEHFFSYHAQLRYDSEDMPVFPSRGAKFQAEYAYFTDDFASYQGHSGFSELRGHWRMSFPVSSKFTIRPMVYGRMLFGGEIPIVRSNCLGGYWFGHLVEQQMPFAGVVSLEDMQRHFLAGSVTGQFRLFRNHYVLGNASLGFHSEKARDLLSEKPYIGGELAYFYHTMFGPLGASVGYSNLTDKVAFYVNLGFEF